jgi:subtilase family serine protease
LVLAEFNGWQSALLTIRPTSSIPSAPSVVWITPNRGPIGAVVTVTAPGGHDLRDVTGVRFNGASAPILSRSAAALTVSVPTGATSGPVTVDWSGSAVNAQVFTVAMPPVIADVGPNPVFSEGQVTISGANLSSPTDATVVRVGSMTTTLLTGGTASELRVLVPPTAVTGRVSVTTLGGTTTSATDLVVIRRPRLTFTPATGPPGTVVTLNGTNLATVTDVFFNDVRAEPATASATSIRTTVPDGATRGPITVVTAAGPVSTLAAFTVAIPSDLRVTAVTNPPGAATGRAITIGTIIRNSGGWTAPASSLRLYVSADETLDAADRLLTTRTVASVAAGATLALTTTATIPGDLPPGTYRVLALVDAAGAVREGDETNNVGVSAPISITLYRPNLTTALSPPARGAIGQPILVPHTVRNTGPAPAGSFTVRFHLSADAVLDADDPVIGQRAVGGLGAGAMSAVTTSLRLPATLTEGGYYVLAVPDAFEQQLEIDETNKMAAAGPMLIIPYRPELTLNVLTVPARWGIGQTLGVANTVGNTGLAPATAFTVRFYVSADAVLDATDVPVGSRALGGLPAGAASAAPTSLRMPATMREGEYYLIAVVDAAGQQGELDEANNVRISAPFSVVPYVAPPPKDPGECAAARPLGWQRPPACASPNPVDPSGGDGDV